MKSDNRSFINSILVIDDDENTLEFIQDCFENDKEKNSNIIIETTTFPSQGIQIARKYFFDLILVDITIPYNKTSFGGIEIYKELFPRYGDSSIIAYSQKVTSDFLNDCPFIVNFINKGENPITFFKKVKKEVLKLRKRQSIFVAMPFAKKYNILYEKIKKGIKAAGYRPVRIDEQHYTKAIVDKIFSEIDSCKIVLFVGTDKNPNVYYEAGYARALDKEIITVIDHFNNLPFDIKDSNSIRHDDLDQTFETVLLEKLKYLTKVPS